MHICFGHLQWYFKSSEMRPQFIFAPHPMMPSPRAPSGARAPLAPLRSASGSTIDELEILKEMWRSTKKFMRRINKSRNKFTGHSVHRDDSILWKGKWNWFKADVKAGSEWTSDHAYLLFSLNMRSKSFRIIQTAHKIVGPYFLEFLGRGKTSPKNLGRGSCPLCPPSGYATGGESYAVKKQ